MSKPIRALLLAAGLGTRLRPLTVHTPKCLVPINGKPLLGYWLEKLEKAGCESVLINTHYLSDQVTSYAKNWKKSTLSVETVYEQNLLGTAGTLLKNQSFFKDCTGLLIHADNAMSSDINAFIKAHKNKTDDCLLTMLTFTTDSPTSCGIVKINENGIVIEFHEKVDSPPTNRANGALYAFDDSLLNYLNDMSPRPNDFSNDVLPRLIGRIQTHHTNQPYLDIGTPASLKQARAIWKNKAHIATND